MKTLLFKKSLLDFNCIEIKVFEWLSTKDGIYARTIEGWKLFSSNDFYFWGTK